MMLQRVRFLGRLRECSSLQATFSELLCIEEGKSSRQPPSGTRGFAKALNQKLNVVLKEDVQGVGQAGEVVSVAAGFARNFLIPQKKALPGLDKYVQIAHTFRLDENEEVLSRRAGQADADNLEKQRQRIRRDRERVVRRLTSTKVVFYRNLSKVDRISLVFPVEVKDIVAEVERQLRISMQEECIVLDKPLNALGDFEIPLRLPEDESAKELQQALLAEGNRDSLSDDGVSRQKQLVINVKVRRKGKTGTAKGLA